MLRITVFAALPLALCVLSIPAGADQPNGSRSNTEQQTRDWSAIDTNHDNYVSPEEMEAYLQRVWAKRSNK